MGFSNKVKYLIYAIALLVRNLYWSGIWKNDRELGPTRVGFRVTRPKSDDSTLSHYLQTRNPGPGFVVELQMVVEKIVTRNPGSGCLVVELRMVVETTVGILVSQVSLDLVMGNAYSCS